MRHIEEILQETGRNVNQDTYFSSNMDEVNTPCDCCIFLVAEAANGVSSFLLCSNSLNTEFFPL